MEVKMVGQDLVTVQNLLTEFRDRYMEGHIGRIMDDEFEIDTGSAKPTNSKAYRINPLIQRMLREHLTVMQRDGLIRPSNSPWASPCFFIRKPGKDRLVVDYRKLNAVTRKDRDRPPRIDEVLERVGGSRIFSKFDLNQGFHQLPVNKGSIEKTAFITPLGCFEYLVMPFGVTNGPAAFQKYMRRHFQCDWCEVFVDDVVIHSRNAKEHLEHLRWFFQKLRDLNLTVKASKCVVGATEIEFLGHHVSAGAIQPGTCNAEKLLRTRIPKTRKHVQGFLGAANYFRKFVRDFAKKALPLTQLLKGGVKFVWGPDQQAAFEVISKEITDLPKLAVPNWDRQFRLETDANEDTIGGVLLQDGRPLAFVSRTLNQAERNYAAWERECLAIVEWHKYFSYYLEGADYVVVTDAEPLGRLFGTKEPKGRHARWVLEFQSLDGHVVWRPGKENVVADYLTRLPPEDIQIGALWREWEMRPPVEDLVEAQTSDYYLQQAFQKAAESGNPYLRYPLQYDAEGVICLEGRQVIPESMCEDLIKSWHGHPVMGHQGANKLYAMMARYYFWPYMKSWIKHVVKICPVCQKLRGNPVTIPLHPELGVEPLSTWQIDFSTLPKTPRGNTALLVIIDVGTRFPFAFALKDQTSESLVRVLTTEVCPLLGVPKVIHSDNAQCFAAHLWKGFVQSIGAKVRFSPIHSPQGKGVVEREIRTLKEKLRAVLTDPNSPFVGNDNWDLALPYVLWGVRGCPGPAGVAPSSALFGVKCLLPPELDAERPIPRAPRSIPLPETVGLLRTRLKYIRTSVQQRLDNEARVRASEDHLPRLVEGSRVPRFRVGDRVLFTHVMTAENAHLGKHYTRYRGPYKVTKRREFNVYTIKDERSGTEVVAHGRSLKAVEGDAEAAQFPVESQRWHTERFKEQRRTNEAQRRERKKREREEAE
jgi:transposase InsO family protein